MSGMPRLPERTALPGRMFGPRNPSIKVRAELDIG